MIAIGVVFYQEPLASIYCFLNHLSKSIEFASERSCKIEEVIFVQNSFDEKIKHFLLNAVERLKEKSPNVEFKFIENLENNIGLARKIILTNSKSEWVYFTDPDVVVSQSVFLDLTNDIKNIDRSSVWAIAGLVHHSSTTNDVEKAFRKLSCLGRYLNFAFQGISKKKGTLVDHAPTAHLLTNRKLIEKIGGFSANFMKCGEDLDLTHRATQQKYFIYFGQSHVEHQQNIKMRALIKKAFDYGKVQAEVFVRNGFCRARLYRLIPAVMSLLSVLVVLLLAKFFLIPFLFLFVCAIVFFRPWILLGFLATIYGLGTISKFLLESSSMFVDALFRQRTRHRFNRIDA